MEVATAISLLTINLIVLSVVIVLLMIVTIVLIVKLNKIASSIQQTTTNVANMTEWFTPSKVFGEIFRVVRSFKKK